MDLLAWPQVSILGHVFTGQGFISLSAQAYFLLSLSGALVVALIYFLFYKVREKIFGGNAAPNAARGIFYLTFAFYLLVTAWAAVLYPPVADEPHYLLIAHSLIYDHDIDLANNYAQKDYLKFYPMDSLDPHGSPDKDGHIFSLHAPGLPLLISPAYWLGGRFGVLFFMCFLGALLMANIYLFCLESGCAPALTYTTCLFMAFSSPLMIHASLIYTEIPAALLLLFLVRKAVLPSLFKPGHPVLFGLLVSLFFWLHLKYAILALVLTVLIWMNLKGQLKQRLLFFGALTIAGLGFAVFHFSHYGFGLMLHGDAWRKDAPSVFSGDLLRGGLGILLDRDFGLLTYAPFYAFAFAGWLLLRKEQHGPAAKMIFTVSFLSASFFIFLSLFTPECWSGSAAPARMITPLVPLLAPFLVRAGEEKILRPLWNGLGFLSLCIGYLLNVFPLLRFETGKEKLLSLIGGRLHFDPLFFLPALYQGRAGSILLGGFYLGALLLVSYAYLRLKDGLKFHIKIGK